MERLLSRFLALPANPSQAGSVTRVVIAIEGTIWKRS